MDPVIHFELPCDDRERLARFFERTFGWKPQLLRTADMPAQFPGIVIGVADIRASMRKVNDNGGQVLGEPMDIPGVGAYVAVLDTEGNRSSLLQPQPMGR